MLGKLPPECKSDWKDSIRTLVHAYNCTHNSARGFSPYLWMYGRQSRLPIDVTLWITQKLITAPTSSKYVQKLRDCMKWAHVKADLLQWKEAQCHKQNYNRCSKAVSLRMADMVFVHFTTFKGWHKIESRWENMNMVEWQPYPNLPVYVVHPIDGGGCSCTLHRNYLLPINNNLE